MLNKNEQDIVNALDASTTKVADAITAGTTAISDLLAELLSQESAGDLDEAQISDVMDDTTAVGIEKHHLHFSANAGRAGYGHNDL